MGVCIVHMNPNIKKAIPTWVIFINMIRLIDLLREAKQVGILYHYTIYENAVDILKDSNLKSGMSDDNLSSVSFTRDKNFHKQHRTLSKFMEPQCRFTFNGDKLSNKYKISPYVQGAVGDVDPFAKSKKGFEAEERITSDKPFTIPLNNYLISFDMVVDYKDQSEWWFRYENQVDAIKLCIEKKVPINMVDKNGSPIPYEEKQSIIQKILNWFKKDISTTKFDWTGIDTPGDPTM